MYPEPVQNGRTDFVLQSWPGLKLWSAGVAGEFDRGFLKGLFNGLAYKVSGNNLYSIDSSGVQTSVASIGGSGKVTMESNGSVIVIVGNGQAASYDGSTLSPLSYSFSPLAVGYLNQQFFFTASDNRVYISTPGTTAVALGNDFDPDSSPDGLVRAYIYDQFIFNFGVRTIEPWQPVAAIPAAERMTGVIQESIGLAGVNAVTNSSKAMYFLGSDGEAYRTVSFQSSKITTPPISNAFKGYSDNSGVICEHVLFESQDFIVFRFPTQDKVWVFSEQTSMWFELDHDVDSKMYLGASIANLFNKNLVGDRENGNIYELDLDTYQDNSVETVRERTCRPLSGEQFNNPRQRMQGREISYSLECGVGNTSEVNPKIMSSLSFDGVVFGAEKWIEIGREGNRQKEVYQSFNNYFTDLVAKVRYTENAKFTLYTSRVLLREAGR